jgi:ATP-dependent Clp protease ATP-binding subunit ClpB
VIKEVTSAEGDMFYSLTKSTGAGGEGAMDAANILKPALARGVKTIGAT